MMVSPQSVSHFSALDMRGGARFGSWSSIKFGSDSAVVQVPPDCGEGRAS